MLPGGGARGSPQTPGTLVHLASNAWLSPLHTPQSRPVASGRLYPKGSTFGDAQLAL